MANSTTFRRTVSRSRNSSVGSTSDGAKSTTGGTEHAVKRARAAARRRGWTGPRSRSVHRPRSSVSETSVRCRTRRYGEPTRCSASTRRTVGRSRRMLPNRTRGCSLDTRPDEYRRRGSPRRHTVRTGHRSRGTGLRIRRRAAPPDDLGPVQTEIVDVVQGLPGRSVCGEYRIESVELEIRQDRPDRAIADSGKLDSIVKAVELPQFLGPGCGRVFGGAAIRQAPWGGRTAAAVIGGATSRRTDMYPCHTSVRVIARIYRPGPLIARISNHPI